MKKHKQKILTGLFILLAAAWLGRSHIRQLFPPAMKFAAAALTGIDNNQKITINDFKGSVVIVSCYQTWCIDCARETQPLNELATNINSEKFKVLYISDEPAEKQILFRQRFSSDKILFLQSAKTMAELGIHAYPTTFLLDKKGTVIKTTLEGYDWLKEKETVRKLMAE